MSDAEPSVPGTRLREIAFRAGYDTGTEALHEFYVPALQRSVSYDRSVGYFSSSSLSVAAKGLSRFIRGGGGVRLLVGAKITQADADALQGSVEIPPELAERLAGALVTQDDLEQQRLEVLAWLASEGRLVVRVAIPVDEKENPILTIGEEVPYFHEKIGVLRDAEGDGVAFQGSVNESSKAWTQNFESFSVFTSWEDARHFDHWADAFERRWRDEIPEFKVYELPDAVAEALMAMVPADMPPDRDPAERPPAADVPLLARFLDVAPRLPSAVALPQATTGIAPFPHQSQVAERLAGQYPRSWLVADEVGLGKTISAALALRRLVLSGEVKRALILAPANVVPQWQDELFEKFGLWVPRLDGGRFYGAHPDDVEAVPEGANPYDVEPILIVSSHLARREAHRRLIAEAAPFDLLVVDEAHHARRQSFHDLSEYRPSLLLKFLDDLREQGLLRAVWLMTATPMQVHPIELRDLLLAVGLAGPLQAWGSFERFYRQLAADDADTDWAWLATMMAQTPLAEPGPHEHAVLERIERRLGPIVRERIGSFEEATSPAEAASRLEAAGREELREWIRLRSPVGHLITRHSRETLKRYRDQGLLTEPIADRDVQDVTIRFSPDELRLYQQLDSLLDRLMQLHSKRRHAGFVLTIYRRRLTSSWEAIRRTLNRRIAREPGLYLELDLLGEVDLDDIDEPTDVDDVDAVPLGDEDVEQISEYLEELSTVNDSKLDQLRRDLDEARGENRSVIVFTQFTDTLERLRDALVPAYRDHLATYSGEGGGMYDPERRAWYPVSKQHLVDAIRSGRCSVLLATDAASEGLNLQACDFLINFDLPWNPMRVEQRIGRIDRIGQQRPVITVRNYTIPGTIEVDVYAALRHRIGEFHHLVGKLQPILGATEQAVRTGYGATGAEREQVVKEGIDDLLERINDLEATGIDFVEEDPLPLPTHEEPAVTLVELERRVTEDLGIGVGSAGRPITFDPTRASRDPSDWRSLMTYGHPRLQAELERIGGTYDEDRGPVVFGEAGDVVSAMRADRSPPEPILTVQELDGLGQAHARKEAEEAASAAAAEVARARDERYERTMSLREADWEQTIRRRFRELIQETLAARLALREMETADEYDPTEEWRALDAEMGGLRYAEAFRQQLGLSVTELVPTRASISALKGDRSQDLRRLIVSSGPAVAGLMREWRSQQGWPP